MPKKIDEAHIFEVVLRLWVERGYDGTTTVDVAELASVNEATLYRRYGSKTELVVQALCAQLREAELRELRPTDDLEGDLRRIVVAYLETGRKLGAVFPLLLIEVSRRSELRPALNVAIENMGVLMAVIQHHQASGKLRKEEPLTTLTALIGPLFVTNMFRTAVPERPADVDVESHVGAFLRGRAT